MLLVVGLLAGGLVSLLLLNTVLAQGSFALESLRERHTQLSHRVQALEQDVAYESSPEVLARKARALNMKPAQEQVFLDLRTGEVYRASGGDREEGSGAVVGAGAGT